MNLERPRENARAAELCLHAALTNAAASRAYCAMFQAAWAALQSAGLVRSRPSHEVLRSAFTIELIRRRKRYPAVFADYLAGGLRARLEGDYGTSGVGRKPAQRLVRRAQVVVATITAELEHESHR